MIWHPNIHTGLTFVLQGMQHIQESSQLMFHILVGGDMLVLTPSQLEVSAQRRKLIVLHCRPHLLLAHSH